MDKSVVMFLVIALIITGCLKTEAEKDTADKLLEYKDSFVGDASAVGNILYLLEVKHNGIELVTDEEPYGIIINISDWQSNNSNDKMGVNAAIIFALVDNVSFVSFVSDNQSLSIEREEIDGKYGLDLRDAADNKEEWIKLFNL